MLSWRPSQPVESALLWMRKEELMEWRSARPLGLFGLLFSTLYVLQPQPWSLLAVVIVHGFTTWGFLSLGDEVMYQRWKRRQG